MTSYCLRFVLHYTAIAEPLRLLRKEASFIWTDEEESAFKTIRMLIKESMPLALFDTICQTVVTTNA